MKTISFAHLKKKKPIAPDPPQIIAEVVVASGAVYKTSQDDPGVVTWSDDNLFPQIRYTGDRIPSLRPTASIIKTNLCNRNNTACPEFDPDLAWMSEDLRPANKNGYGYCRKGGIEGKEAKWVAIPAVATVNRCQCWRG